MGRCGWFIPAAFSACLLLASHTLAQDANDSSDENDVFQLGTVTFSVVVQGEMPNITEKMETSVTRAKIEMFEKKDIGTALARTPGVRYMRPSGSRYEAGVVVRGFPGYGNSGNSVLTFIDGIQAYFPYDYVMDTGRFTTNGVSTISLSKGYSSVLYGPGALGGVINIVSQRPTKPLYGNFVLGAGSGDLTEASGIFGTRQDKWYAQAGWSYLDREFIQAADTYSGTDGAGQKKDTDRNNYGTSDKKMEFKFGFIPNDTDEYVVSYMKQTGQKGPRRDSANCSTDNLECWALGYMETTWEWPYWDRETVSFVSSTNFGNVYIKPRVFYDQSGNGLYNWGNQGNLSRYDDYSWGASLESGYKIENNTLAGKFDYKFNQHKASDLSGHDGGRIDGTDRKYEEHIFFFAVEDTYRFNEHWEVQGGLLYSLQHTTPANSDAGRNTGSLNSTFPGSDIGMDITNFDTWSPQAALFYNLNRNHSFHYSISRKTVFPSMRNRYSNYGVGDNYFSGRCNTEEGCPLITVPNPDLKPEQALHHEIGWDGMFYSKLNIDLAWYYSRHNDMIGRPSVDTTTYPGFAVQQVVNISGDTRRQGFDLGIEYTATDRILVGTSFSYLHSFNNDNPDLRFTNPPYNGSVYASIGLNEWVALIPALDYTARSRAGGTGENRWNYNGGYALADLKLSITPPMHRNISINIGVENLFNKDYRNWANRPADNFRAQYPTPGRYLYANVRYKL